MNISTNYLLSKVLNEPWVILEHSLNAIVEIVQNHNKIFDKSTFHGNVSEERLIFGDMGESVQGTTFSYISGSVGIMRIEGPIVPRSVETMSSGPSASLEKFSRELSILQNSKEVETILLSIDSPGGMVTGTTEFASLVKNSSKPIYSYVYGYGASGAYWIASQTQKIYLSGTAQVGSIGAAVAYLDNKEKLKKEGVEYVDIVSTLSPNKRLEPNSEEGKKEIVRLLDGITESFISAVAEGRKTTRENVLSKFGQGKMFLADEAVSLGMADEVITFSGLLEQLNTKKKTPKYGENKSMDIATLKKDHPEVYSSVFAEGVKAEQTRLEGIDSLVSVDPTVAKFVNSKKFEAGMTKEKMALAIFENRSSIVAQQKQNLEVAGNELAEQASKIPAANVDFAGVSTDNEDQEEKELMALFSGEDED